MNPKNRIELIEYFKELGFTVGAEIGVFAGYFSDKLLESIPDLRLYCIDPWTRYGDYRQRQFEKKNQTAYQKAKELLTNRATIIRAMSKDAMDQFPDNSLDFVYIDANHSYTYVKEDIEGWCPKVRPGGIVAGHDYYKTQSGNDGVREAVDEYTTNNGYTLYTTPWDKVSIINHDDRQPNWYFFKP